MPATMTDGYIPSDSDVCSGRGIHNWNMKGTVNFRKLIHAAVGRYMAAPLRNHKTAVVVSIVHEIRRQGGHFFKERKYGKSGPWCEIGDTAACKKVGHLLRIEVNKCAASAVKSQSGQRAKKETKRAADAARDCVSMDSSWDRLVSMDSYWDRLTETSSLPSLSVQLVKEETPRRASLPSISAQLVSAETRCAADAATDCDFMESAWDRVAETSPLPSLARLVSEETICAVDAAGDCYSAESAGARLVETLPLPSLSPSASFSSFSSFTEETTLDDFVTTTTGEFLLFDGCYL
jgi:hypothetical protein